MSESRRVVALVCGLSVACLFVGCASLNRRACESGDWYGIGVHDGRGGLPIERLSDHEAACRSLAVVPDRAAYEAGHRSGRLALCTPQGAIVQGLHGSAALPCADMTPVLEEAHRRALDVANAERKVEEARRQDRSRNSAAANKPMTPQQAVGLSMTRNIEEQMAKAELARSVAALESFAAGGGLFARPLPPALLADWQGARLVVSDDSEVSAAGLSRPDRDFPTRRRRHERDPLEEALGDVLIGLPLDWLVGQATKGEYAAAEAALRQAMAGVDLAELLQKEASSRLAQVDWLRIGAPAELPAQPSAELAIQALPRFGTDMRDLYLILDARLEARAPAFQAWTRSWSDDARARDIPWGGRLVCKASLSTDAGAEAQRNRWLADDRRLLRTGLARCTQVLADVLAAELLRFPKDTTPQGKAYPLQGGERSFKVEVAPVFLPYQALLRAADLHARRQLLVRVSEEAF